jgi:hypothetical protein
MTAITADVKTQAAMLTRCASATLSARMKLCISGWAAARAAVGAGVSAGR